MPHVKIRSDNLADNVPDVTFVNNNRGQLTFGWVCFTKAIFRVLQANIVSFGGEIVSVFILWRPNWWLSQPYSCPKKECFCFGSLRLRLSAIWWSMLQTVNWEKRKRRIVNSIKRFALCSRNWLTIHFEEYYCYSISISLGTCCLQIEKWRSVCSMMTCFVVDFLCH